jgi:hypothetical protein
LHKREQAPALPENSDRALFGIVPVLKCPAWLRQTGRYTFNFNGKLFFRNEKRRPFGGRRSCFLSATF